MKLIDKTWVRRTRAYVRDHVRTKSALRSHLGRIAKGSRKNRNIEWLGSYVLAPFLTVFIASTPLDIFTIELLLLLLFTSRVFFLEARYLYLLTNDGNYNILFNYPIDDKEFFQWRFSYWMKKSSYLIFLSFFAYIGIAMRLENPDEGMFTAAIGCAILNWGVLFVSTIWLVQANLKKTVWIGRGISVGMLLLLFTGQDISKPLVALSTLFPVSWATHLYMASIGQAPTINFWLMVPSMAAIGFGVWGFRRLQMFYLNWHRRWSCEPEISMDGAIQISEQSASTMLEASAEALEEETGYEDYLDAKRQFQVGQNEDAIRQVGLSKTMHMEGPGLFSQMAIHFLTDRNRTVLEFLTAGKNPFPDRNIMLVIGIQSLGILLGISNHPLSLMLQFSALAICWVLSISKLSEHWPGMQEVHRGDKYAPVFSMYPVSFNDISEVLGKTSLLRMMVWAIFAVFQAAILAAGFIKDVSAQWQFALVFTGFGLAILPCSVVMYYRSSHYRFHLGDWYGASLAFAALFMVNTAFILFFTALLVPPLYAALAWTAFLILSLGFWKFHGVAYDRGRIDQVFVDPPK